MSKSSDKFSKIKNIVTVSTAALFLGGFSLWSIIAPDGELSTSERRPLNQFPELKYESVMDGSFMTNFEKYTLDQFPLRDRFRTLKSITAFYALGQLDNNDIYIREGTAAKIEYPMNEQSLAHAAERFSYVYDKFIKDKANNVYLSVVPDKGYFLADKYGYPTMDYDKFVETLCGQMEFAQYIDIMQTLEASDYYATDTHWRQEKLVETAKQLAQQMGVELNAEYTVNKLGKPFYGVYCGQSALPLPAEDIYYLTNPIFDDCTVFDFETGKEMSVYDMEKGNGIDPYELFLSGSKSLISIENPNASTDKQLVIFRDSFGSSISPLLIEGYSKITLVDIRYMMPQMLPRFIDFTNQDVLFLYSTSVLNNSETIK